MGRRIIRTGIGALAGIGLSASALPTPASAAEVFIRFEENAQADWAVVEDCADGSQAQLFVTVIAGLEYQSPDPDDVNEFVNVQVRGSRCDGTSLDARGNGPAEYTSRATLRRARFTGTVALGDDGVASVDVAWVGTGRVERRVNRTRFPGFIGTFRGRQREAEATGTVALDEVVVASGPANRADLETLEDRNITFEVPER